MTDSNSSSTPIGKRWWQQPKVWWLAGIPIGGFAMFAIGILFWGGLHTAMAWTNTEKFCATMCHEMRDFLVPEWKQTIHYSNRTGVRAACPDCHVPKPWGPYIVRKFQASFELYHKAVGTISTREKFEAKRLYLAKRVWDSMRRTDSRECRNCHEAQHMNVNMQEQFKHDNVAPIERTCIDCHKGIAHKLPDGFDVQQASAPNDAIHANVAGNWTDL